LIRTAEQRGYRMQVLEAVEAVNERQKGILYEKFEREFDGEVEGRCVAMWGLSFKPETDDMREAPSLVLIERLLSAGCRVRVFDPIAMDEARRRLGDRVEYCASKYEALEGADALMIVTEWKQFRLPNWARVAEAMKGGVVIDGRNIYERHEVEAAGLKYLRIG
ncbi:MAG: UDP-glucose/GDP-mannose dehydrogenase family protein, partial [Alistipes sp.]|nr:UDP-glucose/GDP-mannose dehydrogenase family protein [Alistipes sp.]